MNCCGFRDPKQKVIFCSGPLNHGISSKSCLAAIQEVNEAGNHVREPEVTPFLGQQQRTMTYRLVKSTSNLDENTLFSERVNTLTSLALYFKSNVLQHRDNIFYLLCRFISQAVKKSAAVFCFSFLKHPIQILFCSSETFTVTKRSHHACFQYCSSYCNFNKLNIIQNTSKTVIINDCLNRLI